MPIDYGTNNVTSSGNVNISGIVTATSGVFTNLTLNGTVVSTSGHTHTASSITDFNEAVDDRIGSGLFVAGTGINLNYNDGSNSFTISTTGLINNPANNRILTSRDNTTTGIDAESNLTFSNNVLTVGSTGNETPSQIQIYNNNSLDSVVTLRLFDTNNNIMVSIDSNDDIDTNEIYSFIYPLNIYSFGGPLTLYTNDNLDIYAPSGTTLTSGNLRISNQTTNTIASFDSNKNIVSLSTGTYPSLTELSYVKGVTSAIQTQLNSKQNTLTNPVTGTGAANHIAYWSSSTGIVHDASQLYWDATNNRLGIGTSSPQQLIHISGDVTSAGNLLRLQNNNPANKTYVDFRIGSTGNYEDHFFISRSGNDVFGIDTSNRGLFLGNCTINATKQFQSYNNANAFLEFQQAASPASSANTRIGFISDANLIFLASYVERMRLTGAGNLGIGTSSPSGQLHVVGTGLIGNIQIDTNTIKATNSNGSVILQPSGTGKLQGDSSGNSRGNYSTDWQRYRSLNTQVASGSSSTICGGRNNTASSNYTVVAGGISNTCSGYRSAILGGSSVAVTSSYSVIGAGSSNAVSGDYGSILGGANNGIGNNFTYCSIIGGNLNKLISSNGAYCVIGGGDHNTISANYTYFSSILGGAYNTISSSYSQNATTICGGTSNSITGGYNGGSFIGGGGGNTISGYNSACGVIIAGDGNSISATDSGYCAIVNGVGNTISGTDSDFSLINNGSSNAIVSGSYSTIINGINNKINSNYATIVGGQNNISSGNYSCIFGGQSNNDGNYDNVFILGSSITGTQANTTYIQNLIASSTGIIPTISGSLLNIDNLRLDGNTLSSTNSNGNILILPTGTGKVGIGTSSPSGSLHIVGTGLFTSTTGVITPNALLDLYSSTSGDMIFNVEGTNGSLFSVIDNLSGSLMSVNNNAGLPIFEVFSDDKIVGGRYNQNDFVISSGGNVGIGTSSPTYKLHVIGSGNFSQDVLVNGISVRNKSLCYFTPLDNQPPVSGFATLDTRNSIAVLDFDDTTNESGVFVGILPENASLASGLNIRIHWAATSATSGTCRWGVQFEKMTSDLDVDSFDATVAESGSTTNATNGIPTITQISCTGIDSLVSGDLFRIVVYRDPADTTNDTMTGDAELIAVEVRSVL